MRWWPVCLRGGGCVGGGREVVVVVVRRSGGLWSGPSMREASDWMEERVVRGSYVVASVVREVEERVGAEIKGSVISIMAVEEWSTEWWWCV